jgi:hypothetical protein
MGVWIRRFLPLLVGVVLVGVGVVDLGLLHRRADRIREQHAVVDGRVVASKRTFGRAGNLVTVEYSYAGRNYRSLLLDIGTAPPPRVGSGIDLSVDPARATDAAADGLVSGRRREYLFLPVWYVAVVLFVLGGAAWRERRRTGVRPALPGLLVHPGPVWAAGADDVVRTLILGTLPAEEELPARAVGNGTWEICCVPFRQMRLALGDLVRLDPSGYVGPVVHYSGRVSIAVRCADEPAAGDLRELLGEFPAAVLEEIDDHGSYAIAALDDDEARRILARLEVEEQAGRLIYRCALRTDGVDAPLI